MVVRKTVIRDKLCLFDFMSCSSSYYIYIYKGNNKITEQPENCENRNDPDLVQAFRKKWWVESDFKAPNLPLSLRLKVYGCHYNSMYNNT